MLPLLFDVPPSYGRVFMIAMALWVVPECVGAFRLRSADTANRSDRGSYAVFVGGVVVGVAGAFACAGWLPQFAITSYRFAFYWTGIILMVSGIAFRWYAIRKLGRAFTQDVATTEDQVIVQDGPYRFIRHPTYAGTLLTIPGVGLVLANLVSIVLALAVGMAGMLYRINVEERVLLAVFGVDYEQYAERTKRLIPFVW